LYPKVSIITVYWNCTHKRELISDHISSLKAVDYPDYEVIMVDNGSVDETSSLLLSTVGSSKRFKLVRSPVNLYYAGGNNLGYRYTSRDSEYMFLVNPDTVVDPSCIKALVELMERDVHVGVSQPNLGAYAPAFISEDMFTIPVSDFGLLNNEFYPTIVTGALMCVRRRFLMKRGFIFNSVPLQYFDDDVLCVEAWNSGYAVKYYPIYGGRHVGFAFSSSRIAVAHYNTARLLKLERSDSKYRRWLNLIAISDLMKNSLKGLMMLNPEHVTLGALRAAKVYSKMTDVKLSIYNSPYIKVGFREFLTGLFSPKSQAYGLDKNLVIPESISHLVR
jgi:GT2 family glycosyltransferase